MKPLASSATGFLLGRFSTSKVPISPYTAKPSLHHILDTVFPPHDRIVFEAFVQLFYFFIGLQSLNRHHFGRVTIATHIDALPHFVHFPDPDGICNPRSHRVDDTERCAYAAQ